MTLDEQRNTIERALGERMLNLVFTILRQWAKELGFGPYSDRIHSLSQSYSSLFDYYLASDDAGRDDIHNSLTTETYRLADEMYAAIRIKRGVAPEMHGFNPDNPESVMRYFGSCPNLQDEDYDWLISTAEDHTQSATALIAFAALCNNLHESFQEKALAVLIDLMDSPSGLIAEQALVQTIIVFAQWDLRCDFFPDLQNAFLERIGDGERAYLTLKAIIKSSNTSLHEMVERKEVTEEDLPEEICDLIHRTSDNEEDTFENKLERISKWLPKTEAEFLDLIVSILPDTWVFDVIVGENEERLMRLEELYLQIGYMDMMWDRWEEAEDWLVERLRTGKASARDYINYAHCCFLRGDRLMAYENYREAKRLCKSNKDFFALFRPDRKALVDKGIPLEQVYLMEDQLLQKS